MLKYRFVRSDTGESAVVEADSPKSARLMAFRALYRPWRGEDADYVLGMIVPAPTVPPPEEFARTRQSGR